MEAKIPTDKGIVKLYEKYGTPLHIRSHMQVVATVAVFIGRAIVASSPGIELNVPLTRAAAFLHDIGKIFQLEPGLLAGLESTIGVDRGTLEQVHHGDLGRMILVHEGYPVVGDLVALHLGSTYAKDPSRFHHVEERILLMADMRVLDTTICSLEERMVYIEKRYGLVFGSGKKRIRMLEGELATLAGFTGAIPREEICRITLELLE